MEVSGSNTRGKFIGDSDGTVNKCYFAESVVLTANGEPSDGTAMSSVTAKVDSELLSYAFLVEELYWETEYWVVSADGSQRPTLQWANED